MLEKVLSKEVLAPLIIIAVSILVYGVISRVIKRLLRIKMKRIQEKRQNTFVGLVNNIVKYFIVAIALMMILEVYGIDTKSLVASLGVVSLVAGLALQDILKDIIVGFGIILEDQFSVGDSVTISDFTGTVTYLGLRTTRIRAYTGEVKIIANRNITEVINHSMSENNALVYVDVSYDCNLEKVREILDSFCVEFSKENSLSKEAQCLGVDDLGESGIRFCISIPTPYAKKAAISRKFRAQVKEEFVKEGITIPYPQVVVHHE